MEGGSYFCPNTGVDYTVEDGQQVKVLDEWCRKTGLRKDDGSMAFMDRGSLVKIEMLGGAHDGMRVQFHDMGNDLKDDEDFFA
jgi:hypothetical protein